MRSRETIPNPFPEVGGPRRKVHMHFYPVSIWRDDGGWHTLTTRRERTVHVVGQDYADDVFARVCRSALSYEDYLAKVKELEKAR